MDKIMMQQMHFYGFHGLLPEERKLGQRFDVDVEIFLNLQKAGTSDDLNDSIDYSQVYQTVKDIVEGKAKNLIEAVAEEIAKRLFTNFASLEACRVRIIKPNPPIAGHYESVAVEIFREKDNE